MFMPILAPREQKKKARAIQFYKDIYLGARGKRQDRGSRYGVGGRKSKRNWFAAGSPFAEK